MIITVFSCVWPLFQDGGELFGEGDECQPVRTAGECGWFAVVSAFAYALDDRDLTEKRYLIFLRHA